MPLLAAVLWWFCQSGAEPARPSVSDSSLSHSLGASSHCSVSFSESVGESRGWRVVGEVCIAVVTIILGRVVLQAAGHSVPHYQ